jgi:hypothetical protein
VYYGRRSKATTRKIIISPETRAAIEKDAAEVMRAIEWAGVRHIVMPDEARSIVRAYREQQQP